MSGGRVALGAAVVIVMVTGGWYVTADGRVPADSTVDIAGLRTSVVARRDVGATVLATGVIRPKIGAEVRVGSRVSGVLQRLDAGIGERVRQGQRLAQLEDTPFLAARAEAEAVLATAQAELTFAEAQHGRAVRLQSSGAITDTEFAEFERGRSVAKAAVAQAEARVEMARIQLSYTRIEAPIAGVVASVSTQVGETVAANFAAPTFLTIIDLNRLEVWAYVDETDIGLVAVGQPARFTVDTYVDTEFTGVVSAIRPQAEIQDAVVNYVTVIQIDPGHGKILRPEMTTTNNIVLDGREDVVAAPNGAIRQDTDGSFVLRVGESNRLERRGITRGFRGGDYTEITSGLVAGDVVVVGPLPNGTRIGEDER